MVSTVRMAAYNTHIDDWLAYYRAFWTGNLDALARFVEKKR